MTQIVSHWPIPVWAAAWVIVVAPVSSFGEDNCNFLKDTGSSISQTLDGLGGTPITLQIPRNYMPGPLPRVDSNTGKVKNVLVQMFLGTLRPYNPLRDKPEARPFSSSFSALLSRKDNLKIGLATFQDAYLGGKRSLSPSYQVAGRTFSSGVSNSKYELLVQKNAGRPTDVLLCAKEYPDGGVPNPLCQHLTTINGVTAQMTYSRNYISDWQDVKTKLQKFIDCTTPRI